MSVLEMVREVEAAGVASSGAHARLRAARERLKASLVERLGLPTIAGMLSSESVAQAKEELGVALEAILNTQGYEDLMDDERASVVRQVIDEVCGLGPLQPLLEDDEVTEVMVNGCSALFYERAGSSSPRRRCSTRPSRS